MARHGTTSTAKVMVLVGSAAVIAGSVDGLLASGSSVLRLILGIAAGFVFVWTIFWFWLVQGRPRSIRRADRSHV
jgi:hypothetical protein